VARGQGGLANLRTLATIVGMVLALGILAMTVGLIRGEAAGDVRTLTATGATSLTRRTLTSATAAGLAVLGVALGTIGAFLTLVASHVDGVGDLSRIPAMHLGAILVGTPIAAACAGWLFAGREPAALARNPIE
jgi:putative ABC transport system permease protein